MNQKSIVALTSVAFSIIAILSIHDVYAEVVSLTVDVQTILLEPGQVIPLLDTKSVGNMTKLQVSATLPCDASNVPKLKIFAGALGKLVSVIDSSSDYKNFRGPFNTCYYEDTIAPSSNVPVINKVFLNNTGSSSVVTNLGSIVTLTAAVSNATSVGGSQPTFSTDFTECTTTACDGKWLLQDSQQIFVNTNNNYLSTHIEQQNTNDAASLDLGSTLANKFVFRTYVNYTTVNTGTSPSTETGLIHISNRNSATPSDTGPGDHLGWNIASWSQYKRIYAAVGDFKVHEDGTIFVQYADNSFAANQDYCYEIVRDGSANNVKLTIYNDQNCTDVFRTTTISTAGMSIDDLRYVWIGNRQNLNTSDNEFDFQVKWVKVWNGVTSVP